MRILSIILASILSFSSFAMSNCPQAVPTSQPGFCPSFKSVAACHCQIFLPPFLCNDMNTLYNRMISMFGSIQKACEYQKDTTVQNCLDNWSCYRQGGKNSKSELCSSTGNACPATRKS